MIANLTLSIMLSSAIASGGVSNNSTTFNNAKNSTIAVNQTYEYNETLAYNNAFFDQLGGHYIYYTKYKATTNIQYAQTIYGNIESYSYSFIEWDYDLGNNPPSSITYTLQKTKNVTFYKINLYQGATDSNYNMYYTYQCTSNTPITMIGDLNMYEYTDYYNVMQYMDINNLENIRNYDPTNETTLLHTDTNITMLYNQTQNNSQAFNFGAYILGTIEPQAFCIITESTTITNIIEYGAISNNYAGIIPKELTTSYNAVEFNYEVVDIPNIMLIILTLPFSFISQAFNPITLFPNTPYALNIGNIILVIITTLILIWIVKKIIKLR